MSYDGPEFTAEQYDKEVATYELYGADDSVIDMHRYAAHVIRANEELRKDYDIMCERNDALKADLVELTAENGAMKDHIETLKEQESVLLSETDAAFDLLDLYKQQIDKHEELKALAVEAMGSRVDVEIPDQDMRFVIIHRSLADALAAWLEENK